MNLGDLVAIDVHAHAEVSASGRGSLGGELERASARYFRAEVGSRPTLERIAGYYRQRRLACVVFPVDAERPVGSRRSPTRRSPRPPGRTPGQGAVRQRFPAADPDRWLREFDQLDIKPEVRPKILRHNAARLLDLK